MKHIRIICLVLSILLCVGMFSACSSPEDTIAKIEDISESERSERQWIKLLEAYNKTGAEVKFFEGSRTAVEYFPDSKKLYTLKSQGMLPTPEPTVKLFNPDWPDSSIELLFNCEASIPEDYNPDAQAYGKLYVIVDNDISDDELMGMEESNPEEGIFIQHYPYEEEFEVELGRAGEHNVRAFIAEHHDKISGEYKEKHTVKGKTYNDFAFSQAPGTYTQAVELSFTGNEDAYISYTTNGKDPYNIQTGGMVNATDYKEPIKIGSGTTTIKARCIHNGVVSPLIEGTFIVNTPFSSYNTNVGESSLFDIIGYGDAGLQTYDKAAGKFVKLVNKGISSIAVNVRGKSSIANENPEIMESDSMSGSAAEAYSKDGECVDVWYVDNDRNAIKVTFIDGNYADKKSVSLPIPRVKGKHWVLSNGKMTWTSDEPQVGTEELARKTQLMVPGMAVTADGAKIIAYNTDGSNQRVLYEDTTAVTLDAMTDKHIFFRTGSSHWILDIATGTKKENTIIKKGRGTFIGYTSTAAYFYNAWNINRVPIDYTSI